MAFPDFHDDTFVAFCDISGFKSMMSGNSTKAIQSLGKFYETVYSALQETRAANRVPIYGLVVTDCAVLVAANEGNQSKTNALEALLSVIATINKKLLEFDLMITTSISHGEFHYEQRMEFFGIEKNMVTGAAYIEAFKNQSAGSPKLKCGQCRIIPTGLPPEIAALLDNEARTGVFRMVIKEKQHFYFYWMRDTPDEIAAFNEAYGNTENLKFLGIRLLLNGNNVIQVRGGGRS